MTLRVHPDEIVAKSSSGMLAAHSSWVRVRLDQIASVLNGCAFPSTAFGKSGDMPLIRIRDVGRESTGTWYTGAFDPQYVIEHGSLIVGMDGEFRVDAWRGPPSLLNQRVCKIAVRDSALYSKRFLRWVLPGYLEAVNRETSSVTVKHLSSQTIKELPLPLPPIAEQERIVAAIEEQSSRLDSAVAALERVRQNLKRMRAAVLVQATQGWPEIPLGDVSQVFVGATPSRSKPEFWRGSIPWVSSGEVAFCRIHQTRENITEKGLGSATRLHPPGTVLLAMIGEGKTRGQVAILDVAAAHNQNSAAIRLDKHRCLPEWLFYVLMARYEETRHASSGGNQPALNSRRVRAIPIPLPSLNQQHRIVGDIDRQLSLIDAMTAEVDRIVPRSAALHTSILEQALTGTLVPQDPNDEQASVLLERIGAQLPSSNGHKPVRVCSQRRRKITA